MMPAQYLEVLGWVDPDVWHAHHVKLAPSGIELFADSGTSSAHCPCASMLPDSGIAPLRHMCDAVAPVGFGVEDSASNVSADMTSEARQAMLLQRLGLGPDALTARQVPELAMLRGGKVLKRDDEAIIAPGMMAELAVFDLGRVGLDGAGHDRFRRRCSLIRGRRHTTASTAQGT